MGLPSSEAIGRARLALGGEVRPKVLITGCGRSGTSYMSSLMRKTGLDMPHEVMGRDGMVGWQQARDTSGFDIVLHQVRHPLRAISSAQTIRIGSWRIIRRQGICSREDP